MKLHVAEDTGKRWIIFRILIKTIAFGVCQTPMASSDSSCYYDRPQSYLRLAPVKVEELSSDPPIVIFRRIVSDDEIEVVKSIAKRRVRTADMNEGQGCFPGTVLRRWSAHGCCHQMRQRPSCLPKETVIRKKADVPCSQFRMWIHSELHWWTSLTIQLWRALENALDFIQNLTWNLLKAFRYLLLPITGTCEANVRWNFRVTRYGIGGHYVPHYDHVPVRYGPSWNLVNM